MLGQAAAPCHAYQEDLAVGQPEPEGLFGEEIDRGVKAETDSRNIFGVARVTCVAIDSDGQAVQRLAGVLSLAVDLGSVASFPVLGVDDVRRQLAPKAELAKAARSVLVHR